MLIVTAPELKLQSNVHHFSAIEIDGRHDGGERPVKAGNSFRNTQGTLSSAKYTADRAMLRALSLSPPLPLSLSLVQESRRGDENSSTSIYSKEYTFAKDNTPRHEA